MGALARLEQGGAMTTADLARAESMKPQSMGTILAGSSRSDWSTASLTPQTDARFSLG